MRRGIIFLIILAVLVLFAWQVVLKPKPAAKSSKKTKTTTTESVESSKKKGKKAGKLKRLTKEEKAAEKARLRAERKRQKQELRRRKREERLARTASKRKKASKGRSKKTLSAYVLQAIIWFDVGPSYAMIDGRKYEVGDMVSGRKILSIKQDQIIVDYRGAQTVVRMGESLLPKGYFGTERRRRS